MIFFAKRRGEISRGYLCVNTRRIVDLLSDKHGLKARKTEEEQPGRDKTTLTHLARREGSPVERVFAAAAFFRVGTASLCQLDFFPFKALDTLLAQHSAPPTLANPRQPDRTD